MARSPQITQLVKLALEEDCYLDDVTSRVALPNGSKGSASFVAKEEFVFCSAGIVEEIIECSQMKVTLSDLASEGSRTSYGMVLGTVSGSIADLLTLERTILNFLQRLSGVATLTARYVAAAGALTVLDTRKTTPGWRLLEKYAVTVGGGRNHRMNLSDMVLIKNNHIDAYKGDLKALFAKVYAEKPHQIPIEVEVRTMKELQEVLFHCTPEVIMLDNMNDDDIKLCAVHIKASAPTVKIEISGGMTIERLAMLSSLDLLVSVGALTTQARCVDISMRLHA